MEKTINRRIEAFKNLGKIFQAVATKQKEILPNEQYNIYEVLDNLAKNEHLNNGWFIERFIRYQFKALANILTYEKLKKWLTPYWNKILNLKPKKIGVIFAGNIPLVGFNDILAVLITGHILIVKLSSKDKNLPKALLEILKILNPEFKHKIIIQDNKLTDYQAIIATGSNNSARYFKYYFSNIPNIIRTNKTSIAILTGTETEEQLRKLADDILLYFGLGCRNVSKIFIPQQFDINKIFKAIYHYKFVIDNHKYYNNYIYNRTIYLMNDYKFWDNGFFILKEDSNLFSPVSVLFYERYDNLTDLKKYLNNISNNLQTIVSGNKYADLQTVSIGKSQLPELDDYADDINTLEFLTNL